MFLTVRTASIDSICCLSLWIRSKYRDDEISLADTARMSSGCDGKCRSIFLECPNPGSLVEKKKFSSTTGLRSTNTATKMNNTAVTASISQYAPESFFQISNGAFIDPSDLVSALARVVLLPVEL